jgi:hypothetical protein
MTLYLLNSSRNVIAVMTEAVITETSVSFYEAVRRSIPQDGIFTLAAVRT